MFRWFRKKDVKWAEPNVVYPYIQTERHWMGNPIIHLSRRPKYYSRFRRSQTPRQIPIPVYRHKHIWLVNYRGSDRTWKTYEHTE